MEFMLGRLILLCTVTFNPNWTDRGKGSEIFCLPVSRLSILLEMKLQNRDLAEQTSRLQPSYENKAGPN